MTPEAAVEIKVLAAQASSTLHILAVLTAPPQNPEYNRIVGQDGIQIRLLAAVAPLMTLWYDRLVDILDVIIDGQKSPDGSDLVEKLKTRLNSMATSPLEHAFNLLCEHVKDPTSRVSQHQSIRDEVHNRLCVIKHVSDVRRTYADGICKILESMGSDKTGSVTKYIMGEVA
jgi:hypothetical protein